MQETYGRIGFHPWVGKIPWRRARQPTPVFLPEKYHGQEEPGGLQSMGLQRVTHDWAHTRWALQISFIRNGSHYIRLPRKNRPSRRPAGRTQLLSVGKLDHNQGTFLAWVTLRHVSLWQNQACHGGPKLITSPVLCVGRTESAAVPLTLANHTHCCGYLQNYNVASSKKKEFAVKQWEVSLLRVQETLLDSLHVPLQPILLFV